MADLAASDPVDHTRPVRSPRRRHRRVLGVALLVLFLVATGCASDAPLDTMDPQGPNAQKIDDLLNPVLIVAGLVFLFVELGIVYLVIRYRRRKDDDDELPDQTHGNLVLELGWTILPAVILAGVAYGTLVTLFELEEVPDNALSIDVVGQQWWWEFQYDIDDDGETDFRTANEMVIPINQPVDLDITSRDVIHSFWIPALNGKRDAVPGRHHPLTLEADQPGVLLGPVHGVLRALPRQHAHAGDRAARGPVRGVARQPDGGGGGGHGRRRGRPGAVHLLLLALPRGPGPRGLDCSTARRTPCPGPPPTSRT